LRKILTIFLLLFSIQTFAFEKLSDVYTVYYGNKGALVHIVQYYSFTCPHCIALFRKQFQQIKDRYINTGKVSWVFHPVPMDLLTVQGMECLQSLSEQEKKIFLEAILEEVLIDRPTVSALMMQKGMEVIGKPIPQLLEKEYLSETATFFDAFNFLKQEEKVEAVPAVEINGVFLPGEIPDIEFIERALFAVKEKL